MSLCQFELNFTHLNEIGYDASPYLEPWFRALPELAKRGYVIGPNPEFVIADQFTAKRLIDVHSNIVLFHRADSAGSLFGVRTWVGEDNVRGVLKLATLRSPAMYDEPLHEGIYHRQLMLGEDQSPDTAIVIDPETHKDGVYVEWFTPNYLVEDSAWKIHCPFGIGFSVDLEADRDEWGRREAGPRALDVILIASPHTHIIAKHRNLARETLSQIPVGRGLYLAAGISRAEYWSKLRRAKICLSPWGHGEYCKRDYEAILAGCEVIKPDTRFATTIPELYPHVDYYPCASDFSDLAQVVETALAGWEERHELRKQRRSRLVEALSIPALADSITSVFMQMGFCP